MNGCYSRPAARIDLPEHFDFLFNFIIPFGHYMSTTFSYKYGTIKSSRAYPSRSAPLSQGFGVVSADFRISKISLVLLRIRNYS